MEVGVWAALRPAIAVALGAIAGALGRYYISLACLRWWGATFPWATVVVNLVGAGPWAGGLAGCNCTPAAFRRSCGYWWRWGLGLVHHVFYLCAGYGQSAGRSPLGGGPGLLVRQRHGGGNKFIRGASDCPHLALKLQQTH
jgi:hypothetical protein